MFALYIYCLALEYCGKVSYIKSQLDQSRLALQTCVTSSEQETGWLFQMAKNFPFVNILFYFITWYPFLHYVCYHWHCSCSSSQGGGECEEPVRRGSLAATSFEQIFLEILQRWWFQSADSPSQDVWGPPLQNLVAAFPHPQHLRNARETQPGEGSVWQVIKKMFLIWSVISWSHLCRPGLLLYPVNSWCYPANSQVYSTNITRPKFIACSDSLKVSYFAFNIFLVIRE